MHEPNMTASLLRVFFPFAAGYFLSYLYRTVNAVLAPQLLVDLGLSPSSLGLLTATYFIAFASFQLPLGVLLDRYGPRRIEALLLLIAALGAFSFARAESLGTLILGRALIGLGVSACLMAAFKAYTQWFAADHWPLINGLQMASGGLGALAATSPITWLLQLTDWRGIFIGLAVLTFLVAILIFVAVPEQTAKGGEPLADQLRGVAEVYTSRRFWRIAPLTALSQATFFAVQGLWAGPWLRDVLRFEPPRVVGLLSLIALAMVAGFIVIGTLAGRLQRWGISTQVSAVGGMLLFMLVQGLLIAAPHACPAPLWAGFGFFGTSGIVAYAALSRSFAVERTGRVITAINLLVFVAAFAGQWVIGVIVGLWPATAPGRFAAEGLRAGFAFMLLAQSIALLWFFLFGSRPRQDQSLPEEEQPESAMR